MAEFKTRLYDLRKQRDLTQYELAQSIGVNKQTVALKMHLGFPETWITLLK